MMLGGMDIFQVEAGTEIEHEGEKLIVSDSNAVCLGRKIYVTERVYQKLKSSAKPPASCPKNE